MCRGQAPTPLTLNPYSDIVCLLGIENDLGGVVVTQGDVDDTGVGSGAIQNKLLIHF